ncbi:MULTISPECIES: carboxymuconolactone decarboxylase family protein [Aquimarina]|uniref:carboxymuconolactone decarboxylase family protein n=1 Tax=Aquimarina TaxID=290174 RepID=UPI000CDECB44|nr:MULTISPECIES: carboxymuconolactone decarboxylase family protein [Aquimarina]
MSTKRINIYQVTPEYYKPLLELDKMLREKSLTTTELLLIYIRGSQINGCAFCIQYHIKEAIELGEKQYRIHALSAWEDAPFFTTEEQLILKMTEEVTLIADAGLSDITYKKAIQVLGETKVVDVLMAITCINAWNRMGRATLLVPDKSQD